VLLRPNAKGAGLISRRCDYGRYVRPDEQEKQTQESLVPKLRDVEKFLTFIHQNEEQGQVWLVYLLNIIVSKSTDSSAGFGRGTFRLFVPEDVQKLLLDNSVYRFEIEYPSAISSRDILSIYLRGGMLSLTDVGEYIKKLRRERLVTLEQMEQKVKLSTSILARLEAGLTEQIKLVDVLLLDKQLGQEGMLLSMYWDSYRSYEYMIHHGILSMDQDVKLITLFMKICRWLQYFNPLDISWMINVNSFWRSA
jgi:hypothetical protein